jgi:arylsulfatase A-like enzyme
MIGTLEAVILLLGVGAGEYDALFWGALGYGLAAVILSPLLLVISFVYPIRSLSVLSMWNLFFCFTAILCTVLLFTFTTTTYVVGFFLVPIFVWLGHIFLSRTPLKVLPTVKGTSVFYSVLLLLLGVFSLTPGRNIYAPPIKVEQSVGKKNILLLLVDGLRNDHLRKGITPALDALGKRSLSYEKAFANSPTSYQSVAGIFSGHLIEKSGPLSDEYITVAEHLAYHGYQTIAVMNQPELGRFSNLHQGFEFFRFLPPFSPVPLNEGARRLKLFNLLIVQWAEMSAEPGRLYRPARDVFFHLRREIEKRRNIDDPWFAVAQLRETKAPLFYQQANGTFARPVWPLEASSKDTLRAYNDELRRIDHSIGRFLLYLRQSNLDQNTIVIVTAPVSTPLKLQPDQPFRQSSPQNLSVPLLISSPDLEPQKIRQRVQLMDIPKTIVSLANIPPHQSWMGVNVIRLQPTSRHRPIFASSQDSQGEWEMVQQGEWKYIRHGHRYEELYNTEKDPFEENNLATTDQEQRKIMYDLLIKRRGSEQGN